MTGGDDSGANSVGAAMGCAPTIGSQDSGPVWTTEPLWPLLIPPCESMITGLRALSGVANAFDATQTVVSTAAMAAAKRDWGDCCERTQDMGGPVGFEVAGLPRKTSYLTPALSARLVDIRQT
ncbi:hypothetical protein [Paraburkholderia panacisoli]|uniref:hypothetical protein n=1 Tax=Paraburkholderia panacisoli TaxID=2603818 RepID=UPI00165EF954